METTTEPKTAMSSSTISRPRTRKKPAPPAGPTLRAGPFGHSSSAAVAQLLSDRQRTQLAAMAAYLRLPAKTSIYNADSPAASIWIVDSGVVKSTRELPSGRRQITAFLFAGDLFGLAENGKYVNSIRTVTPVALYRMPRETLTEILKRDSELEFQFLCKIAHELRELQRQSIMIGRRDAPGRLAMFIALMARNEVGSDTTDDLIPVPMSRTDIAEYLNLTPEAVSRATQRLAKDGIAVFDGRHTIRILDRDKFERLVSAV
jgi:CRP/FNR family transcriptional regulator